MGEMMPAVNSMSGVGKFSATELKKQLSGKTASVQPSVENYTSAMGRRLLAQGHRDDAPAALPQFHAAPVQQGRRGQSHEDAPRPARQCQVESRLPDAGEGGRRDLRPQSPPSDDLDGDRQQVRLRTAARHLRQALPRSQRIRLHVRGQHRPRNAETPRGEIHRFDPRRPQTDQLRRRQGLSGERRGYGGVHGSDAAAEGLGQLPFLG